MARLISFFDGATSGTVPTIGNLVASNLVQYIDDATYEATESGAPAEGNIYFNTTSKCIRYYTGTSWVNIVDEEKTQTLQNKTVDGTNATGNNTVSIDASDASYNNATSGLSASDSQAAIDEIDQDVDDLNTLSGVAKNATDLGTFAGSTITDNVDIKTALSEIETSSELKEDTANKGIANGYAGLDGGGKVPAAQLPSTLMVYLGNWVASTNTPTLADGAGTNGDVYKATDSGTVDFGSGNISFDAGDWVIYNGSIWEKSDNTDQVTSVFTRTGDVTAQANDYTWAQIDKTTSSIDDITDVEITGIADGQIMKYVTANSRFEAANEGASIKSVNLIKNLGFDVSVAANAATIAIKQADGSTDATSGNPVQIGFDNLDGSCSEISLTGALSLVIPSGATIGHGDGTESPVFLYAINDGGTMRLAVSSMLQLEGVAKTSVAISAASDDNGFYSDAVYSSKPIRLLGMWLSTQTTAGTWASATGTKSINPQAVEKYIENIEYATEITTGQTTSGADTYIDSQASGATLTLPPGKYRIHYSVSAAIDYVSGSNDFQCNFGVFDSSNNLIGNSTTLNGYNHGSSLTGGGDDRKLSFAKTIEHEFTDETTIKLRHRVNRAAATGTMTANGQSVSGGLTNPDNHSILTAKRIR